MIDGKLSFVLPKKVEVSRGEIRTMLSLDKEGLTCFRDRDWKNVYFTDGTFDVLSDLDKTYVWNSICSRSEKYQIVFPCANATFLTYHYHFIVSHIESGFI